MKRLLLAWRLRQLRHADYLFELQLAAFDSGLNPDIRMIDLRFKELERIANAVKRAANALDGSDHAST